MAVNWVNVRSLSRISAAGERRTMEFVPGVNVLVGPPNTGKSKWLHLLNYLFGDPTPAERALGSNVAAAYVAAEAVLTVGGRKLTLERRWTEPNAKGKVFVDDDPVTTEEFSDVFLPIVGLPVLRFPKGDPYAPRKWPRLSWRMLYRHIYRHEGSWTDLADQQPPSEQFACLAVFLGMGEKIFPTEYGAIVDKQKRIVELEARREQYLATLEEITRELLNIKEASVALTAESLVAAEERLATELSALEERRARILQELQSKAESQLSDQTGVEDLHTQLGERLAELRVERDAAKETLVRTQNREAELARHLEQVHEELGRLERAQSAAEVLADLRITHCPACDQPVEREPEPGRCVLCLQALPGKEHDKAVTEQRLAFEIQQLKAEADELRELLVEVERERKGEERILRDVDDAIHNLEVQLRPLRTAVSWLVPPEVSLIDHERGRLGEQARQVGRIRQLLQNRDELNKQIDGLEAEIRSLEAVLASKAADVSAVQAGDALANGMNEYLNRLNAGGGPARWRGGKVGARIRERDKNVQLTLGGKPWESEVGGTYTCFFLASYQYALLGLSSAPWAAYPGLAIIDLPPNVSDNRLLTDQENYLVEPFIDLLKRPDLAGAQLIVTGHAYEGLRDVHRTDLAHVWESA